MSLDVRRLALVFTLAPLLVLLERFAHYPTRSVLAVHLHGLGVPPAEIGTVFVAHNVALVICFVIGGALAIGIGPVWTIAIGFLVGAAGLGFLSAADGEGSIRVATIVLAAGQGLLRPSLVALAAIALGRPNEHLRTAAFVVLYGAANVAGLLGPAGGGLAADAGTRVVFVLGASVMGAALLLAVLLAGLWWVFRAPAQEEPPLSGRLLAGAGLLIALGVAFTLMLALATEVQLDRARAYGASKMSLVFSTNPAAVLLLSVIALVACLIMHFSRARVSALYFVAAGLCIGAAASLPLSIGALGAAGGFATAAISALAEVAFMPFALSRLAGDHPSRFTPAIVAVWLAATNLSGLAGSFGARALPGSSMLLAALCAGVTFVLGGVLFFAAKPLSRRLYAPVTPSDGAACSDETP